MNDVDEVFELPTFINKEGISEFDMSMLYPPHSIFELPEHPIAGEISSDGTHEFFYHPETRSTTIRRLPGGSMEGYLEALKRTINNIEAWNATSKGFTYADKSAISIGCAKGSVEDRNWYKDEFVYIDEKYNDKYSLFFDICTRRFFLVKDEDNTIRDSFKYCDLKEEKYQKFINIIDNAIWPKFMNYLKECNHMLDNKCIFVNDKCTIVFSGFTTEMFKILCHTRSIIEARALCMDTDDITCFSLDYHNHETVFPLDGTAFNIRKYVPDAEWQEFVKALEAKLAGEDMVVLEGSRDVTSKLKHTGCDTRLKNIDIRNLLY
jgi:hypothetical protein